METRTRSLVKAVIWSALGFLVMALVGLAFTGSLAVGGVMAVLNTVIGLITYVLYERLWARISWGRLDA
ncbi:DUF2061 domain-containing protein [Pelagovum sp. HNIBRBA483]|uniref:DUF2061 domain-containing protein n=1 Tax=Pelagovum sp. HNIBRBA483 TaxID=3233341 RepID=UPI0034A30CE0